MNKKKKNEDAGILSWIVIVILLSFVWPVGVFFLLSKIFGNDLLVRILTSIFNSAESGSADSMRSSTHRTAQNPMSNASSQNRAAQALNPGAVQHQPSAESVPQPQDMPKPKPQNTSRPQQAPQPKKPDGKSKGDDGVSRISKGKKALFLFGWVLIAAGIIGGIADVGSGTVWSLLRFLAVALCGGGMLFTAHTKDKKERLYQNCVRFIGDKPAVDLNALARASGVKPKKLVREIDEMLERGYFPAAAYYDKEHDVLILDPETVKDAASVPKAADPARQKDRFDALLHDLERVCGRIQDREMLEKTVQIRGLTAAIFHAVRENPEKEAQIGNFLSFYFPTTLKLLDSYADFEEKGYQGEKLQQTKTRIESTADTIIAAYQKQLDNLYLHDTLDVDTDIDVLETMLKRDGLSGSDFNQPGTPGTMN